MQADEVLQPKTFFNAQNGKYNNATKQVTNDYAEKTDYAKRVSKQHLPISHVYPPHLSPPSIQIALNGSVSPSD
jgi:hypothetical protein